MPQDLAPEFLALQQAVAGRYSLERELGRGGMGVVFLARDVALDRLVAIKLLPPALAAKTELRDRFLREARTAARLSHPNIVPIHAVEEAGDLVFFVMAFVDGETLGERLRTRGALTPNEAGRLVQETAWALGYAHGRGVVHRDVKPDNIMIERGTGRAIVMDFGIAGAAHEDAGQFGTVQYVSPEQANGEPLDGRSDLYSLGTVAFLAVSGQLPFDAPDAHALLAMHVAKPAPPVASVAPGLPGRLALAIDRCLAKGAADRFPDGEALADAVSDAVEPQRQLPVPIRLWLAKGQESRTAWVLLWYGIVGPLAGTAATMLTAGLLHGWAPAIGGLLYMLFPLPCFTAFRLWRYRRLLADGYSIEDARLAAKQYAEHRREELAYEFGGEPPLWAKIDRAVMWLSGTSFFAGFIMAVRSIGLGDKLGYFMVGAGLTWLGSAILQTITPGKTITRDTAAERRVWFWNTRLGKWFDKIARIGLKKRAVPAELTYRPTEMAIGLAADALFESLPKDQRRELKDLPSVLERLQRDAALMRRTVDDLNGALAGLGEIDGPAGQADARHKLKDDLIRKRDEAARRLASAVAALESVRLGLLRLKAGMGSLQELTADLGAARSLTADLAAARALSDGMQRSAESLEEVERLLGPSRA